MLLAAALAVGIPSRPALDTAGRVPAPGDAGSCPPIVECVRRSVLLAFRGTAGGAAAQRAAPVRAATSAIRGRPR